MTVCENTVLNYLLYNCLSLRWLLILGIIVRNLYAQLRKPQLEMIICAKRETRGLVCNFAAKRIAFCAAPLSIDRARWTTSIPRNKLHTWRFHHYTFLTYIRVLTKWSLTNTAHRSFFGKPFNRFLTLMCSNNKRNEPNDSSNVVYWVYTWNPEWISVRNVNSTFL